MMVEQVAQAMIVILIGLVAGSVWIVYRSNQCLFRWAKRWKPLYGSFTRSMIVGLFWAFIHLSGWAISMYGVSYLLALNELGSGLWIDLLPGGLLAFIGFGAGVIEKIDPYYDWDY